MSTTRETVLAFLCSITTHRKIRDNVYKLPKDVSIEQEAKPSPSDRDHFVTIAFRTRHHRLQNANATFCSRPLVLRHLTVTATKRLFFTYGYCPSMLDPWPWKQHPSLKGKSVCSSISDCNNKCSSNRMCNRLPTPSSRNGTLISRSIY